LPFGHVEWFEGGSYDQSWDFVWEGTTLALLAAAVV